jgi:long-chain acyl-CoA synthetase
MGVRDGRIAFGEDISAKMKPRATSQFQWHEAARLFDGQGRQQRPVRQVLPVIAERPSALALACAMAAAGEGFRIGGQGPAPQSGDVPTFETLTGGSTGTPRRIRRTQASWIASFNVNAGLFGIGPGASVAVLGRLVHSLALYGAVEGLHLGAAVHLLDGLRADRQARALGDRRITHLYATPAQLRLMLDGDAKTAPDLAHVLIGGSKLDASLRTRLADLAPNAAIHEFYGAAETSFITLTNATTPEGSVGQPYPGVEVDIRAGEVWLRSPYLFEGYASDPGSARWDGDWLSVGEMGHWQGASLVLSGRAGRMVTVADQNVFPEEIEAFLMVQPGVAQAAVIARPDAIRGSVITAILNGDPGCEAAILAACRSTLGPLKSPKALIWRQDWPVTTSGKTDFAAITRDLP